MADLPFFICLLFCSLSISSSSPDTNTPTLSEAVKIIQVQAMQALNEKIAEQKTLIQKKEDESNGLKNVIEKQKDKISGLETQLEDSGVLVKFMITVLKHSEEVMISRENMITAQDIKLKEYQNQNRALMRHQQLQIEIITNQNKATENIKRLVVMDKQLISAYKETESSKPSENCEVLPYVAVLAETLGKQKTELSNLKTVMKTETKIAEHLDEMKEEMTKLSNEESDWDVAINYQNIIKQQSNGIRQLLTIASYINIQSVEQFSHDDAGNIIPIQAQCKMDYTTWTDDWRIIKYSTQAQKNNHCDTQHSTYTGLTSGWHRFVFDGVHARIPTHPPAKQYQGNGNTCGTTVASWMDGSLPSLGEPPKDVTMKFSYNNDEYQTDWRKPAKVVACLDDNYKTFYLYHLVPVEGCHAGYCATTVF